VTIVLRPHPGATPLVAEPAWLDQPAVVCARRRWTWREVHAGSTVLAARLARGVSVCNLCDSRGAFLMTWLAALRQRCVQLLPPSGGGVDLASMLGSRADPIIVVDDPRQLWSEWMQQRRHVVVPDFDAGCVAGARLDLAWSPDWDSESICLFTSGSTGRPQPQFKSLGQLARGATLLGARIDQELAGGFAATGAIVCSVPGQHMFGVETSVMLSLVHGVPVFDGRPLLPADVRAAFEYCEQGAAWVATPVHLLGLLRSGESVPNCRLVIVATMPLAPALASQVEQRLHAPVLEVFGSTETGAIAMRRPARDVQWQPMAQVRLESVAEGTRVWGPHFPSPVMLADHVELDERGRFALLGRQTDLIKIGGRRASLAGLDQLLQQMPGLEEGVMYLPQGGQGTDRLVLIHSGEPLDTAAAIGWLRARIDPVFVPRAFIRVARLPRTGAGKIPRSALDRIYQDWLCGKRGFAPGPEPRPGASLTQPGAGATRSRENQIGRIVFAVGVPSDHPSAPGHFPGNPIVPGVVVLDQVVAGLEAALGRRIERVRHAKFQAALRPGEAAVALCESSVDSASFRVVVRDRDAERVVVVGALSLKPGKGPEAGQ